MNKKKIYLISPHYSHEKLEDPSYEDLVDVFEDRLRYWMLEPAKKLLEQKVFQIAAFGILINYFEGIEIYYTGKDSKGKSMEFFKCGLSKVCSFEGVPIEYLKHCSKALYTQTRCGFSHDGLFRNRVLFSEAQNQAIIITWPRKNGIFIFSQGVESIIINPTRFYEVIEIHFTSFVEKLREQEDKDLVNAFKAAVDLKWGLELNEMVIGLTEEKFWNGQI